MSPRKVKTNHKGGDEKITVKAKRGCAWIATSRLSWVTIKSGLADIGDGTVIITIAPSENERDGTITVAGEEVTIEQKGR